MLTTLARYWWVLAVRGVAAVVFGILAFVWPGVTLATLVLLFGAYALVDGVFAVLAAVGGRRHNDHWWALLLEGLLGIGVGVLTFRAPDITAVALLLYIAAWALATGVLEIVAAVRLRKEIEGEWWYVLGGLSSIVFAVLLLLRPDAGALALLWVIAIYAIVFGVTLVLLAFKVRGHRSRLATA